MIIDGYLLKQIADTRRSQEPTTLEKGNRIVMAHLSSKTPCTGRITFEPP